MMLILVVCYLTSVALVHPWSIDGEQLRLGTAWSAPLAAARSATNGGNNGDNSVGQSKYRTPSAFEQRVLELTNEARRKGQTCGGVWHPGTTPVQGEGRLGYAAHAHADDMLVQNYFAHASLDGRSPWDRMADAGYPRNCAGGENLAGQQTAEQAVQGWLNSPGHCANLMNPQQKTLGVGHVSGGPYGAYWVQKFGRC